MPPIVGTEFYLQHKMFKELAGLTNYEIETFSSKYDCARSNTQGIPVFGMMKAINEERKAKAAIYGDDLNKDADGAKLEHEMKKENILKMRILNQTKLGMLILKSEASSRVKRILHAVNNTIKVGIKHASSRLLHKDLKSQRDIEAIITEEWNDAVEELGNASHIKSWEQDGSSALLQTRLSDLEKEDPEFVDAVRKNSNEEE